MAHSEYIFAHLLEMRLMKLTKIRTNWLDVVYEPKQFSVWTIILARAYGGEFLSSFSRFQCTTSRGNR